MHSTLGKLFNIKKTSLIFVLSFFFPKNYEIYSAELFFIFILYSQTRDRSPFFAKVISSLNSLNCIILFIFTFIFSFFSGAERSNRTGSDDTEAEQTTDNPTTPFPTPPASCASPTMYHHPMPHSPNLNLRQSSPYPVENTNLQSGVQTGANAQSRHKNQHSYQHNKKPSLRNR